MKDPCTGGTWMSQPRRFFPNFRCYLFPLRQLFCPVTHWCFCSVVAPSSLSGPHCHPLKLHLYLATMTVNSAVHTRFVCQAQLAWSWRPEKLSTPDGFPKEPPYQVGESPGAVRQLRGTQGQSGGGRGRMAAFE